jgi:TubC N-terminal docking domain
LSPATLLAELEAKGITLIAEGGTLRCRAPRGQVTPALAAAIRENKTALLKLVAQPAPQAADTMPADDPLVSVRVAAFQAQLDAWVAEGRVAVPVLTLPDVEIAFGSCAGCGEPLGADRTWRCRYCVAALHIVLEKLAAPEQPR